MLRLSGFVKNEMDGSVYIEVEGDEKNVNEFIIAVKKGPSWARVDQVDIHQCPAQNYTDFLVK
jgi:acylphosphatase